MIHAHFSFRDDVLWVRHDDVVIRGRAFDGDALIAGEHLASRFANSPTKDDLVRILGTLNGSFAVVKASPGSVFLAVDHVRSIPLFYGLSKGSVYVSDDCHWVERHVAAGERAEIACAEFFHSGYVMGKDTRCPSVNQLRPGEMICISENTDGLAIHSTRYFLHHHRHPTTRNRSELFPRHRSAIENSCRRLIEVANGRQIVIPLSGGHDSRLIAVALRSLGYPGIQAFSYGRIENAESAVSKRVAAALDIPWHFVEYSEALWTRCRRSSDWERYFAFAGTLAGLPHIQDFLAVKLLISRGVLDQDCIVAPGHSLDLLAGSRSRQEGVSRLYSNGARDEEKVAEALIRFHFALWPGRFGAEPARHAVRERIRTSLHEYPAEGEMPNASLFETWDWETRQARFVVNSVRAYEYFGIDWWLPLWDVELCRFWQHVPAELRVGKRWYDRFVDVWYKEIARASSPKGARCLIDTTRSLVASVPGMRAFILRLGGGRLRAWRKHPLAWFGILDDRQRRLLCQGVTDINAHVIDSLMTVEGVPASPTQEIALGPQGTGGEAWALGGRGVTHKRPCCASDGCSS